MTSFATSPDAMTADQETRGAPSGCLAIILAAGLGKRMASALPKPLHQVAGWPMLRHSVEAAIGAGASQLAVVTPPQDAAFREALVPFGSRLRLFTQAEQLGTAHAVLSAREAIQHAAGDIVVLYGDTPLLRAETLKMLRASLYAGDGGAAASVLAFEPADPAGYGRLITAAGGTLEAIVEHKDATPQQRDIRLCNSGVMAFRAEVLLPLLDRIRNDNAAGEYYLTDAIAVARALGHSVTYVTAADPDELLGVNDRVQLSAAGAAMQKRLRRSAMLGGATLIAPDTVTFSADTRLGRDVIVEPNVVFGTGVTVGDGVTIKAFCHLEGARIESGAVIGPFARFRPGTEIGEGARVGNFVEIKQSRVDTGAKINHLTYIGDASVGAGANVGAGTITCNYDGTSKHRTDIGAGAFIGSNTSLVAPVSIGHGAYIGSGSVISQNVPPDALAVTRPPLTLREGWTARRRAKAAALEGGHAEPPAAPHRSNKL